MKNKIAFLLSVFVATAAICWGASPLGLDYLQNRTRIVSRDTKTLDGYTIDWMRRGDKSWAVTNKIVVVNFKAAPKRYSKLKLIVNMKEIGKWAVVKQWLQDADYWDEWQACQFISDDYPSFSAATNTAVKAGLATDAQIKELLGRSEDK